MECIVLAGGLGTRLRSVVNDLPKCMAPVADHPFLYYIFKYLEREKVDHIILSVGHKYEVIQNWVEQEARPFQISYAIEQEPLGTGGAILSALGQVWQDQVLIINGDTFFDVNLEMLYSVHNKTEADMTIALKPMTHFERYGNVQINDHNRIVSFMEKQYCEKGQINGGIYVINKNNHLMNNLGAKFSFETEVLQRQFAERYFFGALCDKYFIDIGIPEDYAKANIEFETLFPC